MRLRILLLSILLLLTGCSVANTKAMISSDEAIEIAQQECGACGAVSIEVDGTRYVVNFKGIEPSDGPMLGGGGGMVIIDSYSGKVINKIFLE